MTSISVILNKEQRAVWIGTREFYAFCIGLGLILFAIHNPYLTPMAKEDMPILFFPQFGVLIIGLASMLLFSNEKAKVDFGPKWLYIPMLVIVASGILRIIVEPSMHVLIGGMWLAIMFCLYLAARALKEDIFWIFAPFVIVESISCIIYAIATGEANGGIVSPTNYDLATGVLVLGALFSVGKNQWKICLVAIAGLAATGSSEAIFAIIGLGLFALYRRDCNKRMLGILVILGIIIIGWVTLGNGLSVYDRTSDIVSTTANEENHSAVSGRWTDYSRAIQETSPLGQGYEVNLNTNHTVHNLPLIIWDQIGPISAFAWLFIVLSCIIKTKWKYAWLAILLLSVWDHFIWTQLSPYWWALAGVSSASALNSDLIFKQEPKKKEANFWARIT